MDILKIIHDCATSNHARIGIGVGSKNPGEVVKGAEKASEFADVVLVGREEDLRGFNLEVAYSEDPPRTLVELLASGEIDGAVRGSLGSKTTLGVLKERFGLERLYRVSLLISSNGAPFFFAPVGIDEGETIADRLVLAEKGCGFIKRLGITPRVGVLSGGRFDDIGRSHAVDQSLAEGEFIAASLQRAGVDATHCTVLVEDAVRNANFIIAPSGITGNLMYRALVLIGGGDGFGAPVLMNHVFVDTSRAKGDYSKPIMLASALTK